MTTIDKQFMAGLAYYLGAQKLGACVIRQGPGIIEKQIQSIKDYETTILIAVPSFILKVIDYCLLNDIDLNKLSVKKIICIGAFI